MQNEDHISASPLPALAISPGIAVGPVYLHKPSLNKITITTIPEQQVADELQRLQQALTTAERELHTLEAQVAESVGKNEAEIFAAQQMMLSDPELLDTAQTLITQQHYSAASALHEAAEHYAQELAAVESELIAARSTDLRDAVARALHHLAGTTKAQLVLTHPVILIAHDLTPSDTASLDPKLILGICTVVGGPTTHAAIIARSLEIPAIAGIDAHILDILHQDEHVALDGAQGLLYLHLTEEQESTFTTAMQRQQQSVLRRKQDEARWRTRYASTSDGTAIQVFANVGDAESARAAGEAGAEGIGLLRTEFLFGGRQVFPDEEEQFKSYVALLRAFAERATLGKTIIARTLDAGADKPFPALEPLIGPLQEANPALGLRGARIHLVHEPLLRQQLRALLRAGAATGVDLHIMFPMITTLEEIRRLRTVYTSVRDELMNSGLTVPAATNIGIMVETPASAVMADVLAREVDFFSIGANDLFQYTMAVDRTNSRVTSMFGTLEPAVWRLLAMVARAGKQHGKLVALCGELAADPRIAPALVGLGIQELSMSPPAIERVKAALNSHSMEECQQRAQALLKAETAAEIQQVLQAN